MTGSLSRRVGIGLLAGATLLAELILTRVLSAGLFHHLAFLVVSSALLGTGLAGVVLAGARRPRLSPAQAALGFAVALPACYAASQALAVEPLLVAAAPGQAARLGLAYALLGAPFFLAGLGVAGLLAAHTDDVAGLYGADLGGAALGSLGALAAVPALSGPDALWLASAAAAGSSAALAGPGAIRRAGVGLTLVGLALCGARIASDGPGWLPLHVSAVKTTRAGEPFSAVLTDPRRHRGATWTTGARVDEVAFGRGVRRLVLDAGAAAVRVPGPRRGTPRTDATLVYELRPGGRFLVIGSGAGWELDEALALGAGAVEGVEINPAVAARTAARVTGDARLTLTVDEGRSYAERARPGFDGIVMIHTISNAASASGAMHLAEDYLLTEEALARLLSRLGPGGLLFVTRPEAQIPRLLVTLRAALGPDRPLAPRAAVWAERSAGASFYGAVLVSPEPLTATATTAIAARIAERRGLRLDALPGRPPFDPRYAAILAEPFDLERAETQVGLRLDPPTDDRPFFHQRRRITELGADDVARVLAAGSRARMALEDEPIAELSSLVVLLETTLIGGLALLVGALLARRRGARASTRPMARVFVYFAGLGLGFMLLEIALVQRLGLLLGRPAVAFAVVFGGLLTGAGIGSALSGRWARPRLAPALAAGAALALALGLPLTSAALGWPLGARCAVALGIVLPVGLALGAPFPLGLARISPPLVPWAFATNAFTSVAATVLALMLAAELGFTAVLGVAAAAYAVSWLAFPPRA